MDQVAQILSVLKKYHFWVLCVLLLLIGLGVWQTAVAKLDSEYRKREGELNSKLKEVAGIARQDSPPNQSVIEAIKQAHEGLKDEVLKASAFLYQVQKASNPWPQVLSQEFIEAASALKPGENYLKPGEEFKHPKYLEEYQNFIKRHLPQLGLIVDVREPRWQREMRLAPPSVKRSIAKKRAEKKKAEADAEKKGAEKTDESKAKPVAPDQAEELVGKVYWDEGNQAAIAQRYEWEATPTTMQVLIAQEDLWVYEALLRIIRDTNEGATSHFKAPVKRIINLAIGQDAVQGRAGASRSPFSASMGGAMMPGSGGMLSGMKAMGTMTGAGSKGGMGGMSMPGSLGGTSSGTTVPGTFGTTPAGADATALSPRDAIARALLDGRYVDQKGQPLAFGATPPFPQFKMMPVRMLLVMDQRRVPRLLAQCANSTMPVEVKKVSLRPEEGQSIGGAKTGSSIPGTSSSLVRPGSMMPGASGAMPGMPGSMPGASGSMPGMGTGRLGGGGRREGEAGLMPSGVSGPSRLSATRSAGAGDEESPWDMTVEIEGIIYIFNPAERGKLETRSTAAATTSGAPEAPSGPAGSAVGGAPAKAAASPAGAP